MKHIELVNIIYDILRSYGPRLTVRDIRSYLWDEQTTRRPWMRRCPRFIQEWLKVSFGTVYVALMQLEQEGLVESCWSEQMTRGGHRRRLYSVQQDDGTDEEDDDVA